MKLVVAAAKLVQVAILVCAGCLFLQTVFLSAQTFFLLFFPTTNVPYLHHVPPVSEVIAPISLAWKEPFEYEAKVYISSKSCRSKPLEEFFKNATEVWHIEPQSLENRYPEFETHLTVNLTDTDWKFMCLFMQKAGQFTPHPNISDSNLLVSHHVFASVMTASTCYADHQRGWGIRDDCETDSTFWVSPNAEWKIHLEDNVYTSETLPQIGCQKSIVVHESNSESDGMADGARTGKVYLPLAQLSSGNFSEWKEFPLAKDYHEGNVPKDFSASIDVNIRIRGVNTSTEVALARSKNSFDKKTQKLSEENDNRFFSPFTIYRVPTPRSTVSTTIITALYPALLSLWILRQLFVVRHLFASVCSKEVQAFTLSRTYLFFERQKLTIPDAIGLRAEYSGLFSYVSVVSSAWFAVGFFLVHMPQETVAQVIQYFAGCRKTNLTDKDKDKEKDENEKLPQTTKGNEDDDPETAYKASRWQTFRLFSAVVVTSSAIEYVYSAYVSGGFANLALVEFNSELVAKYTQGLFQFLRRLFDWAPAAYYIPTIIMVHKRKSVAHVPVAYHLLHTVEFAVIGLVCLYEIPEILDPKSLKWYNVASFMYSVILLIQRAVYSRL